MPRIDQRSSATYIGIDPGKKGGVVSINCSAMASRGQSECLVNMPSTEKDLWDLFNSYATASTYGTIVAVIEHVTTSPQMGVVSAGTFMYGYGQCRMALTAAGIPFEPIRPQVWQKALHITPRKKTESKPQFKQRLRAKAQQLYPHQNVTLQTCDALLIATYCRRRHEGTL